LRFEVEPTCKKPQIAINVPRPRNDSLDIPELHLHAGQHYEKKHHKIGEDLQFRTWRNDAEHRRPEDDPGCNFAKSMHAGPAAP
jgi:hypothetical protein